MNSHTTLASNRLWSIRTLGWVGAAAILAFALLGPAVNHAQASHWTSVEHFEGNPPCDEGTKIEPVADGTYDFSFGGFDGSITITITDGDEGPTFAFETDSPFHIVDSVLVKGGPNANLFSYAPGVSADSGLHAPLNAENEKWYGLSHLCFMTSKSSPTPTPTEDPTPTPTEDPTPTPTGGVEAETATPRITLPPTDVSGESGSTPSGAWTLGLLALGGIALSAALLAPKRGTRRG